MLLWDCLGAPIPKWFDFFALPRASVVPLWRSSLLMLCNGGLVILLGLVLRQVWFLLVQWPLLVARESRGRPSAGAGSERN